VIYGIKQIEKQFPGFEARWTGGIVFDVKESFQGMKIDIFGKGLQTLATDIVNNYWDTVIPPSEKMYIINGMKSSIGGSEDCTEVVTEYAFESARKGEDIYFKEITSSNVGLLKSGRTIATRIRGLTIRPNESPGLLNYIWDENSQEFMKFLRSFYGVEYGNKMISKINNPQLLNDARSHVKQNMDWQMVRATYVYISSCFLLNIRNIKQKTARVNQQRDFYYPKAWGREYKVLSLSQTLTEQSPGPDLPPGYHVRGHFCKGHFKRKPHGVYWWNPQWRGNFSKGIVMKDYKVRGGND
jgi:hypothetical protein